MNLRYFLSHLSLAFAEILAVLALVGCNRLPGRPGPGPEVVRPDEVLDFNTLYKQNCSACHGAEGKGGAAVALADPVYLALVDDATFRQVTAKGVPGTPMPAFARSAGGTLTDAADRCPGAGEPGSLGEAGRAGGRQPAVLYRPPLLATRGGGPAFTRPSVPRATVLAAGGVARLARLLTDRTWLWLVTRGCARR